MNIFIYNTLCSQRVFKILFNKYNVKSSNAAQNYFNLLAKGFNSDPDTKVKVTSILPINSKDQKKIFWTFPSENEDGIEYEFIPLINLPVIRNIFSSIYIFFKIIFTRFPKNENNVIQVDYLRYTVNAAVLLASRIRKIKTLAVVTDLPGCDVFKHSLLTDLKTKLIMSLKYDYYTCVTDQLNEKVNTNKKPSIIIEGVVNSDLQNADNILKNKFDERVLIYAGGIYERYGIKNLTEAFIKISNNDLKLWFFGSGPYVNEIIKYSKIDNRIQYKGVIPNQELIKTLIKATLLINPRPTHEEYTKYSFPSKNLEYMSTGTPLLTTLLPGMPSDHLKYIYIINEDGVDGTYKALNDVLKNSNEDLFQFGKKSKDYVLKTKNNIAQTKKILEMLKSC